MFLILIRSLGDSLVSVMRYTFFRCITGPPSPSRGESSWSAIKARSSLVENRDLFHRVKKRILKF